MSEKIEKLASDLFEHADQKGGGVQQQKKQKNDKARLSIKNNDQSLKGCRTYNSEDIEVLEGLEPVRRRPGMYIGGTDERALHHLVAEVLDNAMDEAVAGYATRIDFVIKEDASISISDNGRGIPVDPHPRFNNTSALEIILTTLHSGGKFSGDTYQAYVSTWW